MSNMNGVCGLGQAWTKKTTKSMDNDRWFVHDVSDSMVTRQGSGVGSPTQDPMTAETQPPETPVKESRRYATRAAVKKLNPKGVGPKKMGGSSRTIGDDTHDDDL